MEVEMEMNMETMVVKTATPALGSVLVFVLLVDIYANLKKCCVFPQCLEMLIRVVNVNEFLSHVLMNI